LSSISFETNSFARIESRAFTGTDLHLVLLPPTISFVPRDAFPESCAVKIETYGSYPEQTEQNWWYHLG
jgi:hypothetical protein